MFRGTCKDSKLIGKSVPFFEANKELKELYVSTDGQFFNSIQRSNYYCRTREVDVYKINRSDAIKVKSTPKKSTTKKQTE